MVSKVEYQRNGDTKWYQGTNTNGTYSYSFTGLTKATAYTFKVRVTDNNNRSKIYENASYKGTTLNNYLVKATVSGGTAKPTQATVDHGKNGTFAITATTGYNLSAATVTGTGCTLSSDKKTLTASNVTSARTCTVTIPKYEYNVTVKVTGGTVDKTPKTVKYGEKVTFTITATTGYNLSAATVTGTGCALSSDKKTLTASNIKAATTCTVTIPIYEYNVTVNVTGGKVDATPKKVKYNQSGTFTITANSGYILSTATVSGSNCTLSADKKTLTASKVTAARTCTVILYKIQTLSSYVTSKVGTSGSGTLAQHTSSLANSAADNSYRYSGNNPNNFVCFGNGSDTYNNNSGTCPDTNLYRIIGVFSNQVKLIKSEYITSAELGIASNGGPPNSSYDSLKRVKKNASNGFYWNSTANNTWSSSTLYKALNNSTSGYLKNLGTWANKVATATWHAGGYSAYQTTPRATYNYEIKSSPTVSAKIGLMYTSDYGFASASSSWATSLYSYDNDTNRKNNWLFNNVMEWTISRMFNYTQDTYVIYYTGYIYYTFNYNYAWAVRPTFYLNTNVNVIVDTARDGSVSKPFRIQP